jgi:hypothetical protein
MWAWQPNTLSICPAAKDHFHREKNIEALKVELGYRKENKDNFKFEITT